MSLRGLDRTVDLAPHTTTTASTAAKLSPPIDGAPLRLSPSSEEQDSNLYSSTGYIIWLCFVAIFTVSFVVCVVGCLVIRCRQMRLRRREAELERERQAQVAIDIARIEANVKIFSEREEIQRKKSYKHALKGQTVVIRRKDSLIRDDSTEGESLSNEQPTTGPHIPYDAWQLCDMEISPRTSTGLSQPQLDSIAEASTAGCSICLERFRAGDVAIHSIDVAVCRHLYHEACIISWLVSRGEAHCPCCRQKFAPFVDGVSMCGTPRTSISSHEEFTRVMPPSTPRNTRRQQHQQHQQQQQRRVITPTSSGTVTSSSTNNGTSDGSPSSPPLQPVTMASDDVTL